MQESKLKKWLVVASLIILVLVSSAMMDARISSQVLARTVCNRQGTNEVMYAGEDWQGCYYLVRGKMAYITRYEVQP